MPDSVHPNAGPALAMLDIDDVPTGLVALDALVKEAPVQVFSAGTVQPGRYLILFGGQVEPVQRSLKRGMNGCGDALVDAMLLPWAEERIVPAILDDIVRWPAPGDTLGILQNQTPPTLLRAVDAALKGALVDLVQLRVADGLGGRSIALLWGETPDVEAAIAIATEVSARGHAERFTTSIVRRADEEVGVAISKGSGFFAKWRG